MKISKHILIEDAKVLLRSEAYMVYKLPKENQLLSDFMGVVFHDDENQYYDAEGFYRGTILRYDTSWSCLMEVIEKIEKLGFSYDRINGDVFINTIELVNVIPNHAMNMFEKTYKIVVEFVKWYNKQ